MTHKGCGGKLKVIDSIQIQQDNAVMLRRCRLCEKCGEKIKSLEVIYAGEVDDKYNHRNYYAR